MATTRGLRVVNGDEDGGEAARLLPVNSVAGAAHLTGGSGAHHSATDASTRVTHGSVGVLSSDKSRSRSGAHGAELQSTSGGAAPPVSKTRLFLAELLGTFTLMLFGIGTNAQSKLSVDADGSYLSKMIGWGFAVAMVRACVWERRGSAKLTQPAVAHPANSADGRVVQARAYVCRVSPWVCQHLSAAC